MIHDSWFVPMSPSLRLIHVLERKIAVTCRYPAAVAVLHSGWAADPACSPCLLRWLVNDARAVRISHPGILTAGVRDSDDLALGFQLKKGLKDFLISDIAEGVNDAAA